MPLGVTVVPPADAVRRIFGEDEEAGGAGSSEQPGAPDSGGQSAQHVNPGLPDSNEPYEYYSFSSDDEDADEDGIQTGTLGQTRNLSESERKLLGELFRVFRKIEPVCTNRLLQNHSLKWAYFKVLHAIRVIIEKWAEHEPEDILPSEQSLSENSARDPELTEIREEIKFLKSSMANFDEKLKQDVSIISPAIDSKFATILRIRRLQAEMVRIVAGMNHDFPEIPSKPDGAGQTESEEVLKLRNDLAVYDSQVKQAETDTQERLDALKAAAEDTEEEDNSDDFAVVLSDFVAKLVNLKELTKQERTILNSLVEQAGTPQDKNSKTEFMVRVHARMNRQILELNMMLSKLKEDQQRQDLDNVIKELESELKYYGVGIVDKFPNFVLDPPEGMEARLRMLRSSPLLYKAWLQASLRRECADTCTP